MRSLIINASLMGMSFLVASCMGHELDRSNINDFAEQSRISREQMKIEASEKATPILEAVHAGVAGASAAKQFDAWLGDNLIDPDSRKVSNFHIADGSVACAQVNAKNRMGGYTGKEWAYATFLPNGQIAGGRIFDDRTFNDAYADQFGVYFVEHRILSECGAI